MTHLFPDPVYLSVVPKKKPEPKPKDGINGKDGIDGKDGRDGLDGKDGKNGKDGRDGKDGKNGPKGDRGERGQPGEAGRDGKDGKDFTPPDGLDDVDIQSGHLIKRYRGGKTVALKLGKATRGGGIGAQKAKAIALATSNEIGTWGYSSGVSGTLTLAGGKKVLKITAIALEAAGTITINGGDTITIPYGSTDKASADITIEPKGNLTDPTIIFTGTDAYFVEHVS